jgi:hypothetical protein
MGCDLRYPVMHKIFGLRDFHVVVNTLVDEENLPETWWQEAGPGLKVATVGAVPPNPDELPGSRRFAHLVAQVRETFDYLLIDAPPSAWFPTQPYSPHRETASCWSSIVRTVAKGSCSKPGTAWKRSVQTNAALL